MECPVDQTGGHACRPLHRIGEALVDARREGCCQAGTVAAMPIAGVVTLIRWARRGPHG